MRQKGITLLELMVVVTIIAILLGVSAPPFITWLSKQKVEEKAIQLLTDIKQAQSEAIRQGSVGIDDSVAGDVTVLKRRVYVALNPSEGTYRIFRWQDEDQDGVPESGEFSPDLSGGGDAPLLGGSLGKIYFGVLSSVDKQACTNNPNAPAGEIVNINNCPSIGGVFQNSEYCIRFNSRGFYEGSNNAKIYLTNGKYNYAITLNITGTLQLCRWDGNSWIRVK